MTTKPIQPPKGLETRIISRIVVERKRITAIKMAIFGLMTVGSATLSIPMFTNAAEAFSRSGFFQYISLIFSDSSVVLAAWSDFISILLESLPISEMISVLAVTTFLLWSTAITLKSLGTISGARRIRTVKAN